jgi:hypothetical protein
MTFFYTKELVEFQNTLREVFEKKRESIDQLLKRQEQSLSISSNESALRIEYTKLGIDDYIISQEETSLFELAILAKECGYNLVTENFVDEVFFNSYLFRVLKDAGFSKDNVSTTEIHQNYFGKAFVNTGTIAHQVKSTPSKINAKSVCLSGSTLPIRCAHGTDNIFILVKPKISHQITTLYVVSKEDAQSGLTPIDALDNALPYSLLNLLEREIYQCKVPAKVYYNFILLRLYEGVGACQKSLHMTQQYVKNRLQFGVPVGSFQGVQHQLADIFLQLEALKALIEFAIWSEVKAPEQHLFSTLSAVSFFRRSAAQIVETSIQLHGGIGFTWEYELHLYLRKVKVLDAFFELCDFTSDELLKCVV